MPLLPPPPEEVTVTDTAVLCCVLPSVPVTVTVYEPGATDEPTETVSVAELLAATEVGESEAVGPVGEIEVLRLIVSARPLVTAVLMVEARLLPCAIVRLLGLALIAKSFEEPLVTIECEMSQRLVSFDHVDCMA